MSRGYPLSFGQQRLWFQENLAPGNLGYVDHAAYLMHGGLDVPALRRAFDRLFERHETLRTTFHVPPGTSAPVQVVQPEHRFSLTVVEAPPEPAEARAETVQAHAVDLAAEGFDIGSGPLLRARLIRWGPEEHALIVMGHHIVVDGWSFTVIADELSAAYETEVRGPGTALPPLPLRYTDFVQRQRDGLHAEAVEREIGFWAEYLDGAPAFTDLPTDRPRPEQQTFAGSTVNAPLSDAADDAIAAICAATRSTPYMTLTALVSVVLRAMTGGNDFVFGTPVAGRVEPELERLVGLFLNLIAVRVRIDPEQSLRELLRSTRGAVLRSLTHQSVPFEQVVDRLRVARRADASPIFQVSMLVNNLPEAELRFPGVRSEQVQVELDGSRYDLTTTFIERDGRWRLRLNYNTDLFDEATMRLLVERIETVAVHGAGHLDDPVRTLPVLGPRERKLISGCENLREPVAATDVVELFTAQSRATPEATAVIDDDGSLTYAELDERSSRLAGALRASGVRAHDVVAVVMARTSGMVTLLLALWKADAVFLPLDGKQPRSRLLLMIERAAPRLIVVDAPEQANGLPLQARTYAELAGIRAEPEGAHHDPQRAAYTMFTSGSTGVPKGVVVSRGALAAFCAAALEVVEPRTEDVCLAVTTYTFDISLLEYLVPLLRGAAVRLLPGDVTDIDGARRALETPGLSLSGGTPTTWRSVLDAGLAPPPGLRLMLGGEATPDDLARRLHAAGVGFWSFYGPTEATVYATVTRFHPPAPETAFQRTDLGRPFGDNVVRVLGDDGEPVPIGGYGRIHLGGPQLAEEYLGQPEETARRFTRVDGVPLYDTGDRGRWSIDGRLVFGGRSDTQVKLRGFRVELDEIELRLRSHPDLRDAVVVLADTGAGSAQLAAHLTAAGEDTLTAEELREWLAGSLPDYMIPALYTYREELPRTANGKLDRAALLGPAEPAESGGPAADEALAGVVRQLAADTLNVEGLRLDDDFFAIGGTSLLAVELVLRLNDLLGVQFSSADVVAAPTPRTLADRVAEHTRNGEGAVQPLVALRPAPEALRPVICLPSDAGTCWESVALLPSIPGEFPVFGLQSRAPEAAADPIGFFADLIEDSFAGAPCVLVGWGGSAAAAACELADELADRRLDLPLTIVRGPGPSSSATGTERAFTELVVFDAPDAGLRDWATRAASATHVVELPEASEAVAGTVAKAVHEHLLRTSGAAR